MTSETCYRGDMPAKTTKKRKRRVGEPYDLSMEEFASVWRRVQQEDGTLRDVMDALDMRLSTVHAKRRECNQGLEAAGFDPLPPLRRANAAKRTSKKKKSTNWSRVNRIARGGEKKKTRSRPKPAAAAREA